MPNSSPNMTSLQLSESMQTPDYIYFSENPERELSSRLEELSPDQFAILVDENTAEHCLPLLDLPKDSNIIRIQSGELRKNVQTCDHIWTSLTNLGFTRKSLLVNLGGGVIGDMGGFAASTYKRGIRFINIPTTLLAAVDANIGGKLGIDFHGYKNHIGIFRDPDAVIISDIFFKTLPKRELRSGFAEVLKHGLINNKPYWESVNKDTFPNLDWKQVIRKSVEIKGAVVAKDYKEGGLRKILNFGHTLGHAIETWYLTNQKDILHGEAISVGMIMESYLATQVNTLHKEELEEITSYLTELYGFIDIPPLSELLPIMKQDKKNLNSEISFSLLEEIGSCRYDQTVGDSVIEKAIKYYKDLK